MKLRLILTLIASFLLLSGCESMGIKAKPLSELSPKYANEHSKFLPVDDVVIHYRDEGKRNGPVLLLIHGVAASLHTWDGWVEQLGEHYRIIRLDLPGFGLTGPDPYTKEMTPEYAVDKLQKFVTTLGLRKFYLAGNSLGGFFSWNYASKYPHRVKKLILLDAAGYPQDVPWVIGLTALPGIGEIAAKAMPKFMMDMNVREVFGDQSKVTDEIKQRYYDLAMREGNRAAYIEVFRAMKRYSQMPDLAAPVKDIKVPTLVMWGEKDLWVPMSVLEGFKRDLPEATFIVYEGAGHTPMEELPVQTARDAHHFLMNEVRNHSNHTQEEAIQLYDTKDYTFYLGGSDF